MQMVLEQKTALFSYKRVGKQKREPVRLFTTKWHASIICMALEQNFAIYLLLMQKLLGNIIQLITDK